MKYKINIIGIIASIIIFTSSTFFLGKILLATQAPRELKFMMIFSFGWGMGSIYKKLIWVPDIKEENN